MELKTKIEAEEGKQELFILREFDLPVDLLFRAFTDPDMVSEWMGTRVVKLENHRHGGYLFETANASGEVMVRIHGVVHDIIPDQMIIRTFEMANTHYPAQLEFLEFQKLTEKTSKLQMQVIYRSVADRDEILKLPFARGINLAHNRLQESLNKLI
jgi:uncharacterized protein YndB with AHSA1/START domain